MSNEWISVKDSLPDALQEVLFYRTDCNAFEIGFCHAAMLQWGSSVDAFQVDMKDVTHWMPLPKPPM